ncbi:MAG: dephospho-CoA kinase [Alphaproteobacteria bacterium]|nr:dephospho-CoA kinase [Alphaproteobacteria bacterium]
MIATTNPLHDPLHGCQSRALAKRRRTLRTQPLLWVVTGSIATGKSTISEMLRWLGVPVFDSDQTVHRLLGLGGKAVAKIAAEFPQAVQTDPGGRMAIDRAILSRLVFGDLPRLRRLEAIVHPLVGQERERFLRLVGNAQPRRGGTRRLVTIDSPLFFEVLQNHRAIPLARQSRTECPTPSLVITASCPDFLQGQRALRRPTMTPQKLAAIRAQQLPGREKNLRADRSIPSGLNRGYTLRRLKTILAASRQPIHPEG